MAWVFKQAGTFDILPIAFHVNHPWQLQTEKFIGSPLPGQQASTGGKSQPQTKDAFG